MGDEKERNEKSTSSWDWDFSLSSSFSLFTKKYVSICSARLIIAKRARWRSRLLLARYLAVQAGYYTYMAICSFYRPHVTVAYTAHYNFQAAKVVKYTTRVSARARAD